jgi:putative RNA 2'-phosphotransferase
MSTGVAAPVFPAASEPVIRTTQRRRCGVVDRHLIRTSKFLSLVLRHRPEQIGLQLDTSGWASVDELLRLANAAGRRLTRAELQEVVAQNDKQRFSLSEDGARIRANQGHSVPVDLGLDATRPPELLFHGTALRNLRSIQRGGLHRHGRQHVHLSPDEATATKVGARHGKPVVLTIEADSMHRAGLEFFLSANGVWLTEHVPARFIRFPDE